jgi:hypothetical protein
MVPALPPGAGTGASPEVTMDTADYDSQFAAEAASLDLPLMDHYQLRIPAGTMADGAVVELSLDDRGILTAVPRIPAPQPEGQP